MAEFTIKQGNRNPSISAYLDEAAGDLTSCTVNFHMRSQTTGVLVVDAAAVLVDVSTREVRYDWAVDDTADIGHYDAEWEVTYPSGNVSTFPSYSYHDIAVVEALA